MAGTIPLAIGYGLSDQETWTMTPAEIFEVIDNRARQRMRDLRGIDTLIAGVKSLYAAAHGVKDAVPADFRMFPDEPGKDDGSALDMTPDAILDRAFANMSKAGD
jgi:hypothetical protein